jgi:lycopene cyclase domain-containing protein
MMLLQLNYAYLAILIISLVGVGIADWRYKLVLFKSRRAALKTWAALMVFFLLWDIAGILLGVFSTNQAYVIGVSLFTPNLPVEEVLFLTLLIYTSLWFYSLVGLWAGMRGKSHV